MSRLIDTDALISEIKKDTKKAIEQDDRAGAFWLGYLAGLVIKQPTVQPEKETPKRVLWSGWKGMRDTRYKCPNCKKPVRNTDIYCHRCGQKLMFPNIDFTPYVEGQKQELIVRWDDE